MSDESAGSTGSTTGVNGTGSVDFGPLEGLRALTSLQRQGIAAATEVAERFTTLLDGFARPSNLTVDAVHPDDDQATHEAEDTVDTDAMSELRSNVARGFDLYSRMFQSTFESWADLVEDRMRDRGIRIGSSAGDVASAVGTARGVAEGELWLHNHTADEVGPFQLIATPGFSADGNSISPAAFELAPAMISVPANTSCKINVTVDLADQPASSVLHAMVLVQGLPDEALPLQIIIRTPPDPESMS